MSVYERCAQCGQYIRIALGDYVKGKNENGDIVHLHRSCLRYYLHAHRFLLDEEVVKDGGRLYTHVPRIGG